MKLVIYPLLSTRSKRAIIKTNKKWGHYYLYSPRKTLINRLCAELKWSEALVRDQIKKERQYLLKYKKYY